MMWRTGLAGVLMLLMTGAAHAQFWGSPYGRGGYYQRPQQGFYSPFWDDDDDDYDYGRRRSYGPKVLSGGDRPSIEALQARTISFPSTFPVNSIVIDTRGRQLFFVTSPTEALHYPISVGREGFSWTGTETISRKAAWPDWFPPEEMRDRDPRLPEKMTGGLKNPLGAMSLYLGTTL